MGMGGKGRMSVKPPIVETAVDTTIDTAGGDASQTARSDVHLPAGSGDSSVLVAIDQVSYSYPNGLTALNGLSLNVERGKVISLVGPSGCGKSTLLGLIAGLTSPSSGRITRNLSTSNGRHPLAMMFQQDTLLPWLTVRENIALFTRFKGRRARRDPAIASRVEELLNLVGLQGFADVLPHELSGGMRRRAAFLAAVAPQPNVLLLDEPFSSVDEPTRIGIHESVFKVTKLLEIGVVLVTHDLAEAVTLSDEVNILTARPGRVALSLEMPFGDVRDMMAVRDSDAYSEIYRELWHRLRLEIEATK